MKQVLKPDVFHDQKIALLALIKVEPTTRIVKICIQIYSASFFQTVSNIKPEQNTLVLFWWCSTRETFLRYLFNLNQTKAQHQQQNMITANKKVGIKPHLGKSVQGGTIFLSQPCEKLSCMYGNWKRMLALSFKFFFKSGIIRCTKIMVLIHGVSLLKCCTCKSMHFPIFIGG